MKNQELSISVKVGLLVTPVPGPLLLLQSKSQIAASCIPYSEEGSARADLVLETAFSTTRAIDLAHTPGHMGVQV